MKTRVNLYTQAFRPKKERFALTHALLIISCSLLLMLTLTVMSENENSALTQQVNNVKQKVATLETEVDVLSDKVARHVQNPALEQQLALLKTRLKYRDELLVQLSKLAQVQTSGFAILMSDLALQRDKDIRLNQIRLAGSSMTLKGIARNHDAIPRWIGKFSAGKSLQGREFSQLNITRNDDDIIAFTLTNTPILEADK
ncbi:MSHA biogenesis protein MshI [Moritella sp. Urea-trap-13]|uniref:MSHA biogenesis protein MshI n=1 Tax=Moritella sp. Urea-trap-13 TaxID=2058327 RepID=UPI000C3268EB|nr:MSHA biogenesis protein MshI [Moritella sp. Urea-trap-13]PKH05154.1 MSHA biogenesis protein MshI [Moritella sp. Urea-trap-13]